MVLGVRPESGSIVGGDFRLIRPLSEGGMGAVWIAEQTSTATERALKMMRPELVADDRARQRFEQEARASGRIRSDHVVQVVAAGVDASTGVPWLAMELLEGETVAEWLAQRRVPPQDETREVLAQLCHALAAAHAAGIVHRDLKPENLFLVRARRASSAFTLKVLDFGIAKLVEEAASRTTAAIGTPLWMAPEQTQPGGTVTPATDVWALGLIAFRLYAGECYWRSTHDGNVAALVREIALDPLVAASQRARELLAHGELPAGFDDWFARCVARDPAARFVDASDAWRALRAIVGGPELVASIPPRSSLEYAKTVPLDVAAKTSSLPVTQTAAPEAPARRGRVWLAIAAASLAVAAAAVAMRARTVDSTPPSSSPAPSASPSQMAATSSSTMPAVAASVVVPPPAKVHAHCPDGMAKIPGGTFELRQRPGYVATVKPFCLDGLEVSVESYTECVEKKLCAEPPRTVSSPAFDEADVAKWSKLCNYGTSRTIHPMNCVDWQSAKTYCEAYGKRLPLEEEWEWAARGGDAARLYPWGSEAPPIPGKKVACWAAENKVLGTCPVGSHSDGVGRFGQHDLAGNVREWVFNVGDDDDDKRVFRGGCFGVNSPVHLTAGTREWMLPENRLHNVGFRCAATLQ